MRSDGHLILLSHLPLQEAVFLYQRVHLLAQLINVLSFDLKFLGLQGGVIEALPRLVEVHRVLLLVGLHLRCTLLLLELLLLVDFAHFC